MGLGWRLPPNAHVWALIVVKVYYTVHDGLAVIAGVNGHLV